MRIPAFALNPMAEQGTAKRLRHRRISNSFDRARNGWHLPSIIFRVYGEGSAFSTVEGKTNGTKRAQYVVNIKVWPRCRARLYI